MTNPREDADQLLSTMLPLAENLLRKHGEFYPFGATMNLGGKIEMEHAATEQSKPNSASLIASLEETFRGRLELLRAVAIACDTRVTPPGEFQSVDAVSVFIDHRDQFCALVFVPYTRASNQDVEFGAIFASRPEHRLFG
jgi:hypothetical protein